MNEQNSKRLSLLSENVTVLNLACQSYLTYSKSKADIERFQQPSTSMDTSYEVRRTPSPRKYIQPIYRFFVWIVRVQVPYGAIDDFSRGMSIMRIYHVNSLFVHTYILCIVLYSISTFSATVT